MTFIYNLTWEIVFRIGIFYGKVLTAAYLMNYCILAWGLLKRVMRRRKS